MDETTRTDRPVGRHDHSRLTLIDSIVLNSALRKLRANAGNERDDKEGGLSHKSDCFSVDTDSVPN